MLQCGGVRGWVTENRSHLAAQIALRRQPYQSMGAHPLGNHAYVTAIINHKLNERKISNNTRGRFPTAPSLVHPPPAPHSTRLASPLFWRLRLSHIIQSHEPTPLLCISPTHRFSAPPTYRFNTPPTYLQCYEKSMRQQPVHTLMVLAAAAAEATVPS